jgi:hypothetical protein
MPQISASRTQHQQQKASHCESRSGLTKRVDVLGERSSLRSQWLALEATVCGMLVVLECREVWVALAFFVTASYLPL